MKLVNKMRFLLLLTSVGAAQTCFAVQSNYSLAHRWRAVYMECALQCKKCNFILTGLLVLSTFRNANQAMR